MLPHIKNPIQLELLSRLTKNLCSVKSRLKRSPNTKACFNVDDIIEIFKRKKETEETREKEIEKQNEIKKQRQKKTEEFRKKYRTRSKSLS